MPLQPWKSKEKRNWSLCRDFYSQLITSNGFILPFYFPAMTWSIMVTLTSCDRPKPWEITSLSEYIQTVRRKLIFLSSFLYFLHISSQILECIGSMHFVYLSLAYHEYQWGTTCALYVQILELSDCISQNNYFSKIFSESTFNEGFFSSRWDCKAQRSTGVHSGRKIQNGARNKMGRWGHWRGTLCHNTWDTRQIQLWLLCTWRYLWLYHIPI